MVPVGFHWMQFFVCKTPEQLRGLGSSDESRRSQSAKYKAYFQFFPFVSRLCQLLRGVTISNGGVLPRIHPELLSKKRGSRVKVDSQATVPDKPAEHSKSKKPVKTPKKVKGKRGRKPKVSRQRRATTTRPCIQA